jgi:hypothetical protein
MSYEINILWELCFENFNVLRLAVFIAGNRLRSQPDVGYAHSRTSAILAAGYRLYSQPAV